MEDRWGKLAIQAHVCGALDFAQSRRYDRSWSLKEDMVMEQLEDQLALDINRLTHAWHCGASRSNMWDEKGEDFEFHRKEADKAYKAIGRLSLPWYNDWAPERTLKELWDDFKLAEKDPKLQAWRQAKKAEMRAKRDKAVAEQKALMAVMERQKQQLKDRRKVKHGGLHRR